MCCSLTKRSLKARGKGAPKKKREKGRLYSLLFLSSPGVQLTATCRHRQEEISPRADGRCMRYELYHYCIEEGQNIPDMNLKSLEDPVRAIIIVAPTQSRLGSVSVDGQVPDPFPLIYNIPFLQHSRLLITGQSLVCGGRVPNPSWPHPSASPFRRAVLCCVGAVGREAS